MRGSVSKRCKCPVERDAKGRRKACRKAHGSWVFIADMGNDPATGKRRQVRKSGFKSSDDAEAALSAFLHAAGTGQLAHDDKLTVADYLRGWIEAKRDSGIRPTTIRSYEQHVNSYLIPHLGRLRLGELRATHVEKFLRDIAKPKAKPEADAQIAKGARRNPKTLSPATIRRVHATLRTALTSAKRKHLVAFNAAENLELPRAARPKVKPWEAEELGKFLDHATTDRLGTLYETMAMTGLRRGETCGLRWDDVDLDKNTVIVRQQLVEIDGTGIKCEFCKGEHRQFQFGKPKTASGEDRVVGIDAHTAGVLLAHRFAQDMERAEWGEAYVEHGLVFARENGQPYPPQYVTDQFNKLTKAAGVRSIRLHDLRHGQASLLLAAGVDLTIVSKRLGHSSIAITADTYSHLLAGVDSKAAEAAAGLVPRSNREQRGGRDHLVTTPADPNVPVPQSEQEDPGQDGAPSRTRTYDLRIKSQNPDVTPGDTQ